MIIYSLLTAKGNNTLKDKNILDLLGNPVLYYPAMQAKKVKQIEGFYVSSECEKILSIAYELGYKKIKRPEYLSKPESQHKDVIKHFLDNISEGENIPDILVVLLGNNITVKAAWIEDCINIMKQDMSISCVTPVYKDLDHNPYRCKKINTDGELISFVKTSEYLSTNRQDLPNSYFLSHNFWVLNVKKLIDGECGDPPWSFMGNKVIPYEIERSIDIHDAFDLEVAEIWVKSQII